MDNDINRTQAIDLYILYSFCLEGGIMAKETDFKGALYKEIRTRCPGSEVIPNDANYLQGFPDATVYLPNGRFVLLEGKKTTNSARQPNQDYYVNHSPFAKNAMFVSPENKDEVLDEIERRYKSEV